MHMSNSEIFSSYFYDTCHCNNIIVRDYEKQQKNNRPLPQDRGYFFVTKLLD